MSLIEVACYNGSLKLNDLEEKLNDCNLREFLFNMQKKNILKWLRKIEEISLKTDTICDDKLSVTDDNNCRLQDMKNEQRYLTCNQNLLQ